MQVVSARISVLVVWMTVSSMELHVLRNVIATRETNHWIWLRIFLEHLWGVYELILESKYMVYFLGLMIMLFINGGKYINVSYGYITETSLAMFLYRNVLGRKGSIPQTKPQIKIWAPQVLCDELLK